MSIPGKQIRLDDLIFNVHIEGKGPAVLLLHGFPDSNALWRHVTPLLSRAGFCAVAPDLRGFGESSAPVGVRHYRLERLAGDVIGLMDKLEIDSAHLVGHDWGAVLAWVLAGKHGKRFQTLTAVSVGHPGAYARAGWEQKRKGWYTLFFQLRGIAEFVLGAQDFAAFRKWLRGYPETDAWVRDLSRPGRLTAALNWYRANIGNMLMRHYPPSPIPTQGIWSTRDIALSERQMTDSESRVDAAWRYRRLDGPSHWIPLEVPDQLAQFVIEFASDHESR